MSNVLGWELEVHQILLLDTRMNEIVAEGEGSPAIHFNLGKCFRALVPQWVSEIAGTPEGCVCALLFAVHSCRWLCPL